MGLKESVRDAAGVVRGSLGELVEFWISVETICDLYYVLVCNPAPFGCFGVKIYSRIDRCSDF